MSIVIYEVPESKIVHETSVDFSYRNINKAIHLVQYDSKIPIVAVSLLVANKAYVLPEDDENITVNMKVRWGKKDRTFAYNNVLGCNSDRTIVYFEVDEQMSYFDGDTSPVLELIIYDIINETTSIACSSSIPIQIDRNPIQEYYTESSVEISELQDILNQSREEALKAINAAELAEGYRDELIGAIESIPLTASELPFVNVVTGMEAVETQGAINELHAKTIGNVTDGFIPYYNLVDNVYKDSLYWDPINLRIGIGTTNPGYDIDIYQSSASLGLGSHVSGKLSFASDSVKSQILSNNSNFLKIGLTSPSGVLTLYTKNLERMRIVEDGNVGIGTTSPTEKLHVDGNEIVTGDLTVGGNLTVTGTVTTIDTETIKLKDNIIEINSGQTGTPSPILKSGMEVNRGDLDNFLFVFDESDDRFKIGMESGLQTVSTRLADGVMEDQVIPMFDATTHSFINSDVKYNPIYRTLDIYGGLNIAKYSGYSSDPFLLCYNSNEIKASINSSGKGYFNNLDVDGQIVGNQPAEGNITPLMTLYNEGSNKFQVGYNGNVSAGGKYYGAGMAALDGVDYGDMTFNTNGIRVTRNVNDANPTVVIDNVQGTGNIIDANFNGTTRFAVHSNGGLTMNGILFTPTNINKLKDMVGLNSASIPAYTNITGGTLDNDYSLCVYNFIELPGVSPCEITYSGRITLTGFNTVATLTLPEYLLRPNLQVSIVKDTPYVPGQERDIAFGSVVHDDTNMLSVVHIGHTNSYPDSSNVSKTIDFCVRGMMWV